MSETTWKTTTPNWRGRVVDTLRCVRRKAAVVDGQKDPELDKGMGAGQTAHEAVEAYNYKKKMTMDGTEQTSIAHMSMKGLLKIGSSSATATANASKRGNLSEGGTVARSTKANAGSVNLGGLAVNQSQRSGLSKSNKSAKSKKAEAYRTHSEAEDLKWLLTPFAKDQDGLDAHSEHSDSPPQRKTKKKGNGNSAASVSSDDETLPDDADDAEALYAYTKQLENEIMKQPGPTTKSGRNIKQQKGKETEVEEDEAIDINDISDLISLNKRKQKVEKVIPEKENIIDQKAKSAENKTLDNLEGGDDIEDKEAVTLSMTSRNKKMTGKRLEEEHEKNRRSIDTAKNSKHANNSAKDKDEEGTSGGGRGEKITESAEERKVKSSFASKFGFSKKKNKDKGSISAMKKGSLASEAVSMRSSYDLPHDEVDQQIDWLVDVEVEQSTLKRKGKGKKKPATGQVESTLELPKDGSDEKKSDILDELRKIKENNEKNPKKMEKMESIASMVSRSTAEAEGISSDDEEFDDFIKDVKDEGLMKPVKLPLPNILSSSDLKSKSM